VDNLEIKKYCAVLVGRPPFSTKLYSLDEQYWDEIHGVLKWLVEGIRKKAEKKPKSRKISKNREIEISMTFASNVINLSYMRFEQ